MSRLGNCGDADNPSLGCTHGSLTVELPLRVTSGLRKHRREGPLQGPTFTRLHSS